jgi:hypothetical protein
MYTTHLTGNANGYQSSSAAAGEGGLRFNQSRFPELLGNANVISEEEEDYIK